VQAQGVNVSAPWGNAPLDMSGLRAVNADLNVTTKRLLFQKMKLDSSVMTIAIKNGLLNATLNKLALYGGAGSGVLTIDGRANGMKFANRLTLKSIDAEPFLTDAMAFNQITGRADIEIDVAGDGATQQRVMDNLSGRAKFAFANGAVKGVDLEKMTSEIKTALTSKFTGPNTRTQFSALSGSFILSQGVARTTDGKMESSVVSAPWTGEIGMARQDINVRVVATMLRSDLKGLSVPVNVTGPWAKVNFKPDIGAVVKDKVQQQIDKALGGKDLSSIFGGKKDENGKTVSPLDSLFGKKKN
jgi:AsmA protein